MNTITSLNIKYQDNAIEFVLDTGTMVELPFTEIAKLTLAVPNTSQPLPSNMPNLRSNLDNKTLFTPAIQAAITGKIINFTEGLMVLDWVNKGFANVNLTGDNPLRDKFPNYWDFLVNYRTAVGDPNAI